MPDGTRVMFIPHPTPILDSDGMLTGAVNLEKVVRAQCQRDGVGQRLAGEPVAIAGQSREHPDAAPRPEVAEQAALARRAMFESNYPVDRWGASYPVLWNAFKRLAADASGDEKRDLFAGTAARVYGLEHLLVQA